MSSDDRWNVRERVCLLVLGMGYFIASLPVSRSMPLHGVKKARAHAKRVPLVVSQSQRSKRAQEVYGVDSSGHGLRIS